MLSLDIVPEIEVEGAETPTSIGRYPILYGVRWTAHKPKIEQDILSPESSSNMGVCRVMAIVPAISSTVEGGFESDLPSPIASIIDRTFSLRDAFVFLPGLPGFVGFSTSMLKGASSSAKNCLM